MSNLEQTEVDSYVYQGIQFSSGLYEQTFKQVKEQKNRLRKEITNRLEDSDENETLFASLTSILNTEIWDIDDDDYGVEEIGALVDRFIVPLKNAGMKASKTDVKSQWRDMRNYSCENLSKEGEDYLQSVCIRMARYFAFSGATILLSQLAMQNSKDYFQ